MDLSIIIPSFNTKHLTQRCLRSIVETLKHSKLAYEIIVIDNASRDGSVEMLNTQFPQVLKILNKENVGYGTANNMGLNIAKGKYALMLNSDIDALNGSLERLYAFAQGHPNHLSEENSITRMGRFNHHAGRCLLSGMYF